MEADDRFPAAGFAIHLAQPGSVGRTPIRPAGIALAGVVDQGWEWVPSVAPHISQLVVALLLIMLHHECPEHCVIRSRAVWPSSIAAARSNSPCTKLCAVSVRKDITETHWKTRCKTQ